jgi:hypothetical protein
MRLVNEESQLILFLFVECRKKNLCGQARLGHAARQSRTGSARPARNGS